MATYEEAIVAFLKSDPTLTSLIGSRIFPDTAPTGTAYPHVIYQTIDFPSPFTLSGPVGMPSPRLQIDVWGRSATAKADVVTIAEAIRKAVGTGTTKFDGFSGVLSGILIWKVELVDRRDSVEPSQDGGELPYRRRSMDFKISFQES